MLQGMAVVVLIALVWIPLVLWPSGIHAPVGLLAVLAAATLAWIQAFLWTPFGLPWARVVVMMFLLTIMVLIPQLGPLFEFTESGLLGLTAGLIPAAGVVAYRGVVKARRGDIPDWRGWFGPLARITSWLRRRPTGGPLTPFASSGRAQLWLEWSRYGLTFPLAVGCFLILHLTVLFWFESRPEERFNAWVQMVTFPPLVASFLGFAPGALPLLPYNAILPLSSADLVAARFKRAALSTLAAYALVVLAILLVLANVGVPRVAQLWWERFLVRYQPLQVVGLGLLAMALLLLVTWRALCVNQFWGLTGRFWIACVSGGVAFTSLLVFLSGLAWWGGNPDQHEMILDWLVWAAGLLVLLKLLVAGWAVRALYWRGLVAGRTLARLLACWLLIVFCLGSLLIWLVPAEVLPVYWIVVDVILLVPLTRLALAPLALEWNRHR
jgi:hypothetical protein